MVTLERPIVRIEITRVKALTQLVVALETTGSERRDLPRTAARVSFAQDSQAVRLHIARMKYAMENSSELERVSDGAWFINRRAK